MRKYNVYYSKDGDTFMMSVTASSQEIAFNEARADIPRYAEIILVKQE